MTKEISEDDRLKALGLVTVANEHYRLACVMDKAVQRLLGLPGNYYGEGKLGDVIYDADGFSVAQFDEALEIDGFAVVKKSDEAA